MRPLLIVFSNLGLGGIQRKIVDIVNRLEKYHPLLPVYVLLRKREALDRTSEIKNKNVRVIVFSEKALVKGPFFFTLFVFVQIWRLRPVEILSFLSPFSLPAIAAKALFFWRKIRVVVNEDHYTSGILPLIRFPILNRLGIKLLYPQADIIISPTQSAKNDLVENFSVPPGKIAIIPNWTSLSGKKLPTITKKFDLIYCGRFAPQKRLQLLLESLAELRKIKKDVTLCLVGDGPEKENLVTFVQSNDLRKNVIFAGIQSDVSLYLGQARIYVNFSQYGAEGFPLSILEAMAVGLPVVSYRFAGATDVIRNGNNGFLFRDLKEAATIVADLLKKPWLRKRVGDQAHADAKKYYSLENIDRYFDRLRL